MKSYLQGHLKRLLDGIFKLDQTKGENNSINWDGTVTLKALPVDPNLFSFLNIDTLLPLKLVRGYIDELSISVPWMSLGGDSLTFKAKNCFALLRLDMSNLYHFDKRTKTIKAKQLLEAVERRIVDTFRQIKQKKTTYIENFLLSILKTCQANIQNLRIKVEVVEFDEVVGGVELVFNELNYENSVSGLSNAALQNTQETNGLRIVDLRLKSLSRDKLLLLKHTETEINSPKLTAQNFKDLFKNEADPRYIVAPILLQFNFTRIYTDETKKKYTRFIQFEVSPLHLTLSNEDLKLANLLLNCFQLTQEYSQVGKVQMPHSFRTTELNTIHDRHRLHRALSKMLDARKLRTKTKTLVTSFKTLSTEYEFCYQVKILHLMEKQFDKETEKLYHLNMLVTVPHKDNAECPVEDILHRVDELEKQTHCDILLALRENVMTRLRNQGYFKKVLIDRKTAIKVKQEKAAGGISDLLRKGISGILGGKKETKHFDDLLGELEQSDSALQAKLNTVETRICSILEVNCANIGLILTRNGKTLLELGLSEVKWKETEQVESQKISSKLFVSEVVVLDENRSKYFSVSYLQKPEPEQIPNPDACLSVAPNLTKDKCVELILESVVQQKPETGGTVRVLTSLEIILGKLYASLSKELLSKLIYFTMDFSTLAKKASSNSRSSQTLTGRATNPNDYVMDLTEKTVGDADSLRPKSSFEIYMLKLIDLDKKFTSHLSIRVEEMLVVCKHSVSGEWVGVYTKPTLKLVKNEMSLKLNLLQLLHSESSSNLVPLETGETNHTQLEGIKKFLKPTNLRASLPRRDKSRVSLDLILDKVQIFLNDEFLLRLVKIGQDFDSIKVLRTENMLVDLKKAVKQPAKKAPGKLSNQLAANRGKIGSITERSFKPSRKGSSYTFQTVMSDAMNDEFFDAFEDETDLLAHQELKSRIDLLQSATMALNSSTMDLHVIEEDNRNRQAKQSTSTNLQSKYKHMSFSMTVKFDELSVILYSTNELENYIHTYITKGYVFFDYKKLELQLSDITMILKQNLLTLLYRDILPLFGSINKVLQSLIKKQNTAGTNQTSDSEEPVEPEEKSNFVVELGQLISKQQHPISINLQLANQLSMYLTEQIEATVIPGVFLSVRPMKSSPKQPTNPLVELGPQGLHIKCEVKADVFNGGEVAYYEPFIEEMIFQSNLSFEGEQLKQEVLFPNLLINVKPSILKNLLDTLSTYSTQNIKRSAELHSVLTIRNDTGVSINITANSSGKARLLKPFDTAKINLFTSAKIDRQSEHMDHAERTHRDSDLSINRVDYLVSMDAVLKSIGRVSDDDGGSKQYGANKTHLNTTSYFGKKRLVLELDSFGKRLDIDLSNMTDTDFQLSDSVFLVAKVEAFRDQTLLTLTSNLKVTNKLDNDVEISVYLRKTVVSKEDYGKHLSGKVRKRKGSGVFSDGDHISENVSVDFNEPPSGKNTFSFPNTNNTDKGLQASGTDLKLAIAGPETAEKEERSSLVFRSIVRSRESVFLPLLKNFPVNYYMITIPATESFFHSISKHPTQEFNRIKTQNEKANRIYFDELMRKDCGISSHQLEFSVGLSQLTTRKWSV